MKIYREVGSLYIVNRKDKEGYERPVYEIEVDEAEPVKHGHWIKQKNWFDECSVCRYHGSNAFRYCPNCGAKMDEVTNETDNK